MRRTFFAVALTVLLGLGLAPAWACDVAPNTHLGVITAVDVPGSTVTLKDAQTGKNLKFLAKPELLKGLAVKDQVAIVYATEGQALRATSITKAGS